MTMSVSFILLYAVYVIGVVCQDRFYNQVNSAEVEKAMTELGSLIDVKKTNKTTEYDFEEQFRET